MSNASKRLFSTMSRIEGMSNQFTKTDWKIVQYIKNNTDAFLSLSAQELASRIGISDASIIRFAQKVGFSGLSELKYIIQNELDKGNTIKGNNSYTSLLQDYNLLTETLFTFIKPDDIDCFRKQLLKSDRLFIAGLEMNRHIAEMAAHKFTLLGLNVCPITSYDTLQLYSKLSTKKDLFIIITLSGNRRILANSIENIVENGSYITLISNYEKSLCSVYADLLFLIPKTNLLDNFYTITREIFILMLFDILFFNLVESDENISNTFHETASFAFSKQNSDNPDLE